MIKELLAQKKVSIVNKWTGLILNTYSEETLKFLKSQKNQFSNPVGNIISNNAEMIFDEIVSGGSIEKINSLLIDIIKIRAVQDFTPSEAVSFVYLLRKVICEELKESLKDKNCREEYSVFEEKIDKITGSLPLM